MFGLRPVLMTGLEAQGFGTPTPIQARAIPVIMQGRDLLGLAQTGTGKTLAFGLPVMHALLGAGRPEPKTTQALILAPTRELVNQIAETLNSFAQKTPLKVQRVVGGAGIGPQIQKLAKGCDILVATPGRLLDLLDRRALSLNATQMLVLDEADQMLDLGFIHALRKIAALLPKERQTLMFSATMNKQMNEIADAYLDRPERIQVAAPGKPADKIDQSVHFVPQGDKARVLEGYLKQHPDDLALVFSRTKHGAEKLMKLLNGWGIPAGSIHGNKSQGQRERTLQGFREGKIKVLVATDVAARGIDIPDMRHVYNFDLPEVPENYVHRIGRTARAGASGRALAFCAPAEMGDLRAIERLMKITLAVAGGAPWSDELAGPARTAARKRNGGGQRPARHGDSDGHARKPRQKSFGKRQGPAKSGGRDGQRRSA
ncbi:DEAD/DEAH box helicase [Roseinatronobacter bogoriensis subsp. barguzinensis]|uniref:DEAD/DEAH box helicase n=2 Tax=Roseinatronobacter bogoriensis TaxID=119542 RepID=A0A2K8KDV0_9RHOB|nr:MULTISPECIES: DEAD/DEAH box helicase [Rhodobaca]ATX65905.1 DEAD/DEAH box helicase [Rhodobaca barguzinensis]